MTIHVVCLDGTNQHYEQLSKTNVALLFDALGGASGDADAGSYESVSGAVNSKYLPGVGAVGRPALRALGNLFGDGIAEQIVRGYTFLSRVFVPGDEVVIIGFSRGAAAARALAGIVTARGLLDPSRYEVGNKDAAYRRAVGAWYYYRKGAPDLANQARLHFLNRLMGDIPQITDADFTPPVPVAAVGVFDTVSSLGVPHLDPEGNAVFDFSICDTTLNGKVGCGFHALAADEVRDLFAPTFWADRSGIVQQIFPGGHSDVGGGYPQHGLSDCVLAWMADRLNEVHDIFDLRRITRPIAANVLAAAHDESMMFPFVATPRRARSFPHIANPSDALRERFDRDVDVLPSVTLSKYKPQGRYADGTAILP